MPTEGIIIRAKRKARISIRSMPGIRKANKVKTPKSSAVTDGGATKVNVKAYHRAHKRQMPRWLALKLKMLRLCTNIATANKPTTSIVYIADIKMPAKDGCAAITIKFNDGTSTNRAKRKDAIITFLDRVLLLVLQFTI